MPDIDREGAVFVLDLGDGENRFNPASIAEVNSALDQLEAELAGRPCALVTRATGKFWSNGLDLDWFAQHEREADDCLREVHRLLARVLVLPMPTVAAITGHAFAAGAMLATAHDFKVMRSDRGYWCLPEVDIGLPFTPGMDALLRARLPTRAAHEAMTTGRRYTAAEAVTAGIIDAVASEGEVVTAAVDLAAPLAAKAGPTLGAIKGRMYAEAVAALREGQPGGEVVRDR